MKKASIFIKEAERYHNFSFVDNLLVIELSKQSGNTSNFEQKLLHMTKHIKKLNPRIALLVYKILYISSNNRNYCIKVHKIYSKLGNYKASIKWLLQGKPIVDGILDLSNKKRMLYIGNEEVKELAKHLPAKSDSNRFGG